MNVRIHVALPLLGLFFLSALPWLLGGCAVSTVLDACQTERGAVAAFADSSEVAPMLGGGQGDRCCWSPCALLATALPLCYLSLGVSVLRLIDKILILPPWPYKAWFPSLESLAGPLAFLISCSCLLLWCCFGRGQGGHGELKHLAEQTSPPFPPSLSNQLLCCFNSCLSRVWGIGGGGESCCW